MWIKVSIWNIKKYIYNFHKYLNKKILRERAKKIFNLKIKN